MDEGVDEELHVEITTNMRQDNDIKTMHPDMEINEFISSQSRGQFNVKELYVLL